MATQKQQRSGPRPVVAAREALCKSDRKALWTVLSDTERITRLVGGPPIVFEETQGSGVSRYVAKGRGGGFALEYEEAPFEWVYPKHWTIVRRFRKGPLLQLTNSLTLVEEAEGGTRVRVEVSMTPKRRWLRFPLKRSLKPILNEWESVIAGVDEALLNNTALPHRVADGLNSSAFERAALELRDMDPEWAGALLELVRTGDELELAQIRPYILAERWKTERRKALAACLHGVRSGLLTMRWGIVCPSCQTASQMVPTLQDLTEHGSCHYCDIDFGINLEESIEALFAPNNAVRAIDTRTYCSGGPRRTPHVRGQVLLPANTSATLPAPEAPGLYRLFVRGGAQRMVEVVSDGLSSVELSTDAVTGTRLRLAPEATIHLKNESLKNLHAKVEDVLETRAYAATAHDVTTMPGFRRDFSSQLLKPGMALEIGRVGVLFTDLCGSTRLYANIGDAAAFNLVQDHFTLLFEIIERHSGSIVKTMGDAIMAVFHEELASVEASLEILTAFETFRQTLPKDHDTHVKLGIYPGPCYAVTANDLLDFFGQTVNIAARLQGEAGPGELVVMEDLGQHAIEHGVLPERLVCERFEAQLKGVEGTPSMMRIAVMGRDGLEGV